MNALVWIKSLFELLGGSRDEPLLHLPGIAADLWRGLWWGLLVVVILLFCGQTSKFIYIDF